MQSEHSKRILASHLRHRLRNSVPSHILDGLDDEQLIAKHSEHTRLKAQLLADRVEAAKKRVQASAVQVL